ncbi:MAG TPA: SDR family oxidoreductase [Jiangellaceae bacterium]
MTTILVTGATGNIGVHLVRQLAAGSERVRAFVRDADKARALLGDQVDLAVGDFADPSSIAAAVDGVDRVFLLTPSHPEMVTYERAILDSALAAGVQRVVKMSTVGADPRSDGRFTSWQGECEELRRASAIPSVILRSSYHMTNLFFFAESIRSAGKIFAPVDEAKIAMVDRRDLAAVAALALTEDGHDGRTYLISGPEAITYHDVTSQLSQVLGKTVEFVDVPDEAATAAALRAGAPEWMALGIGEVHRQLKRGIAAQTSDVVRVLLEREPYGLADFARDTAAVFS